MRLGYACIRVLACTTARLACVCARAWPDAGLTARHLPVLWKVARAGSRQLCVPDAGPRKAVERGWRGDVMACATDPALRAEVQMG